mgnify:CR=1 FL=1
MKNARKFQVTVIGSNEASSIEYDTAYKVGSFIAKNGWILINGGRSGVMEASSKGANDSGGIAVAILPDSFLDEANIYSSIVIPTTIGFARNCITVASADVVVVIGGKSGTLSELTFAWQYNKPIIACGWIDGISKDYAGKILDDKRNKPILKADNLQMLFNLIEEENKKFKIINQD